MPMDLGTRNTLLCDFMHCMTAVSLEMSDEPFFLLAYARAKRAVTPVNKGLSRVSFVRFFMPFSELDLEQNKNEITAILINKQVGYADSVSFKIKRNDGN